MSKVSLQTIIKQSKYLVADEKRPNIQSRFSKCDVNYLIAMLALSNSKQAQVTAYIFQNMNQNTNCVDLNQNKMAYSLNLSLATINGAIQWLKNCDILIYDGKTYMVNPRFLINGKEAKAFLLRRQYEKIKEYLKVKEKKRLIKKGGH